MWVSSEKERGRAWALVSLLFIYVFRLLLKALGSKAKAEICNHDVFETTIYNYVPVIAAYLYISSTHPKYKLREGN